MFMFRGAATANILEQFWLVVQARLKQRYILSFHRKPRALNPKPYL